MATNKTTIHNFDESVFDFLIKDHTQERASQGYVDLPEFKKLSGGKLNIPICSLSVAIV